MTIGKECKYLLLVLVIEFELDIGGTDNSDDRLLGLDICLFHLLEWNICNNFFSSFLFISILCQLISCIVS